MEQKKEIDDINKWLIQFGTNFKGESLFRVVWSEDQQELRIGEFNEFYNDIFLRTIKGPSLRPKYDFIRFRYILEQWLPAEKVYDPDIPGSNEGDYLALYVFQSSQGVANPIEVIRPILDLIMNYLMKPVKSSMLKKSEDLQEYEDKESKRLKADIDFLDPNPIQNALRMKQAVGYTKELKGK